MNLSLDDILRFWSHVDKRDQVSCWLWTLTGRTNGGYGKLNINKTNQRAHRVSWFIHFGTIPNEDCILHTCDNRLCVNPNHLFIGTRGDNNTDRHQKGRSVSGFVVSEYKPQKALTETEIDECVMLYELDVHKMPALAKMYNTSTTTICKHINERRYPL